MKRILAALLAALMLLCWTAPAETAATESDDDFGFSFADDGYDGEWVEIEELGIEFCLPEGWTETDSAEDVDFSAASADGAVSLAIRLEAEGVSDIQAWGEANLNSYEQDEANFYDVLVVEEDKSVAVRFLASEDKLIAFEFARADASALTRANALQIVGTACAIWDDDDVPLGEGDGGDFDFGEAFEEDLD